MKESLSMTHWKRNIPRRWIDAKVLGTLAGVNLMMRIYEDGGRETELNDSSKSDYEIMLSLTKLRCCPLARMIALRFI